MGTAWLTACPLTVRFSSPPSCRVSVPVDGLHSAVSGRNSLLGSFHVHSTFAVTAQHRHVGEAEPGCPASSPRLGPTLILAWSQANGETRSWETGLASEEEESRSVTLSDIAGSWEQGVG